MYDSMDEMENWRARYVTFLGSKKRTQKQKQAHDRRDRQKASNVSRNTIERSLKVGFVQRA